MITPLSYHLDETLKTRGRLIVPARGMPTHNRKALHYLANLTQGDRVGDPVWFSESRANACPDQPIFNFTRNNKTALIFDDGSVILYDAIRVLPLTFRLNTSWKKGPLRNRWESLLQEIKTGMHDVRLLMDSVYWLSRLRHIEDGYDTYNTAPVFRNIAPFIHKTEADTTLALLARAFLKTAPWISSIDIRHGLIADFRGGWIIPPKIFWKGRLDYNDDLKTLSDEICASLLTLKGLHAYRYCSQTWQFSDLLLPLSHKKTGETYRRANTFTIGTLKISAAEGCPLQRMSAHERTQLIQAAFEVSPTLGQRVVPVLSRMPENA